MELPKVSIVIANMNGRHHLRDCFGSIAKLDYPKDKLEVVVVDNGSSDGSVELIRQKYAYVKLLCNEKNEGFAKPSNDGARAASGEYVAFINNDMRLKEDWLMELIGSMQRAGAQCAGSVILNWDGKLLDFAGGGVNFRGLGYQDDFAERMTDMEAKLKEDKEILFACGGAMIVGRALFLEAGGFDEDYFAYYEDVDLGWRLRVMGCKIVLSVKSRVYHKHNSTSKTIAKERVQYLFERNKLYTCYKNYGDELLYKVFMPSIMLQIREAYIGSGIDGFNYNIKNPGAFDSDPVMIDHRAAMKIAALNEFAETIAVMQKKRAFIQSRRKAQDSDITNLIGRPFIVFPGDDGEYLNAEYDLVKAFGLEALFKKTLPTSVLIVAGASNETADKRRATLAKLLEADGRLSVVTACTAQNCAAQDGAVLYTAEDQTDLAEAVRKATVVVLTDLLPLGNPEFVRTIAKKYVAADIESCLPVGADAPSSASSVRQLLDLADFYLCTAPKQKDYLAGMICAHYGIKNAAALFALIENPVKDGAGSLVEFCTAPCHFAPRLDYRPDGDTPVAPLLVDPEGDGDPIHAQLARIEQRQNEIAQLLTADRRLAKEERTNVKELKDWSLLMERRFFKLKHKLSKFRFLRRFVG